MAQPTAIIGSEDIRPGFNETGSTIAAAVAVTATAGSAPDSIVLASAGARIKGVTLAAIADQTRGDVLIRGQAICTAGAAIVRGVNLMVTGVAGKLITATAGNQVVGVARSAASADGDLFEAELDIGSAGAL